jgi:hypothetical protein
MKPKTIVTVVVLGFVAVAVGYLVVKEVRAAREPEVAAAGPSEAEPATAASGKEAQDEGTTPPAGDRKVTVTYYYTSKR